MCRALVGLDEVDVVGVIPWSVPMQGHIASTVARPACPSCGSPARIKQTMRRRLVDLPCFGRPAVTVWRQIRWSCPSSTCSTSTWTHLDPRIVIGHRGMSDRAARWATEQVGRHGRSVSEVAEDLGFDWHTVNRAVIGYGTALVDDPDRIGTVSVLSMNETAFVCVGRWRQRIDPPGDRRRAAARSGQGPRRRPGVSFSTPALPTGRSWPPSARPPRELPESR